MTTIVRLYESEARARSALESLASAGFLADESLLLTPADIGEIEAAIQAGFLRAGSLEEVCSDSLHDGLSVVAVKAQFGRGQLATAALEAGRPVDTELLPEYVSVQAAPLSEILGIPVLTDGRSSSELVSPNFALSNVFGIALLSRSPTPLSSLFGLPTLSRSKGPSRRSFGLPILSRGPTPLSSLFGLPTLSRPKGPWRRSFGLPLLSRNPAPLSAILGLRTLSKRKRR